MDHLGLQEEEKREDEKENLRIPREEQVDICLGHLRKGNRQNGKTYQEPLGQTHLPLGGSLYVIIFITMAHLGFTNELPDQIAAALESFFWPKIFWDFLTKSLDPAIKPVPALQIINLLFGIGILAWEWPLNLIAGSAIHRSLEARLATYPLAALAALLIYQGTNAGIYYVVAMVVYFWAYSEGEVCLTTILAYITK